MSSCQFAHKLLLHQVANGRVDHLVDDRGYRKDTSYNGHQLDEEGVPTLVFAHVQLRHWVGLVPKHHHRNAWKHQLVNSHGVEEGFPLESCIKRLRTVGVDRVLLYYFEEVGISDTQELFRNLLLGFEAFECPFNALPWSLVAEVQGMDLVTHIEFS